MEAHTSRRAVRNTSRDSLSPACRIMCRTLRPCLPITCARSVLGSSVMQMHKSGSKLLSLVLLMSPTPRSIRDILCSATDVGAVLSRVSLFCFAVSSVGSHRKHIPLVSLERKTRRRTVTPRVGRFGQRFFADDDDVSYCFRSKNIEPPINRAMLFVSFT